MRGPFVDVAGHAAVNETNPPLVQYEDIAGMRVMNLRLFGKKGHNFKDRCGFLSHID